MSQSSGGFFYKVSALLDTVSFEKSKRAIESIGSSMKAAAGITLGVSGAIGGAALAASNMAVAELKTARAIGVSTESLNEWKIAASVAGASASALVGSMASLESKMQHMKMGQVDLGLARNLGQLGIGYGEFAEMDATQRMRSVFAKADSMGDQKLAAMLVADTLGGAAREYYDLLKLSGKSLDSQLADARKLSFVTEKNRKDAAKFSVEFKSITSAGKSILQMLGGELAAALAPSLEKVKRYLIENREKIIRGVKGFANSAAKIIKGIAGGIAHIAPIVSGLIDKFGGLDNVILKVGIGIAALKLMPLAGSLSAVIGNVLSLKNALSSLSHGLMMGGLFLILEDLLVYLMGGKSVIGELMPKIKEFLGQFDFSPMAASLGELFKVFQSEKFLSALGKVSSFFIELGSSLLNTGIKTFTDVVNMLVSLINGDWKGAGQAALDWLKDWTNGVQEVVDIMAGISKDERKVLDSEEYQRFSTDMMRAGRNKLKWEDLTESEKNQIRALGDTFGDKAVTDALSGSGGLLNYSKGEFVIRRPIKNALTIAAGSDAKPIDTVPEDIQAKMKEQEENSKNQAAKKLSEDQTTKWENRRIPGMQDGILQPGGKITQVAPDDWVFAVKNVADLAGAFMPHGYSMGGENNFVVNQNINVEGGTALAETVGREAYRGASDALNANINRAMRFMQSMPGAY